MVERVTPHLIELTYNAALKSFWRKDTLRKFLRRCGIADGFLSTWAPTETKRDLLERLFAELPKSATGRQGLLRVAENLAEQTSFPDLDNWEESEKMHTEAQATVKQLRDYIAAQDEAKARKEEATLSKRQAREQQDRVRRREIERQQLNQRLDELGSRLGTSAAGLDFQEWFYDLVDYSEIGSRRPYWHDGRQIDGSITVDGTTYLVELKFTREAADAPEIDVFYKKVVDKADNTMGIIVSVSGYTTVAVKGASVPKTPLLLLDAQHLYLVLRGDLTLDELINRVRRHASQTGEAYLTVDRFSG